MLDLDYDRMKEEALQRDKDILSMIDEPLLAHFKTVTLYDDAVIQYKKTLTELNNYYALHPLKNNVSIHSLEEIDVMFWNALESYTKSRHHYSQFDLRLMITHLKLTMNNDASYQDIIATSLTYDSIIEAYNILYTITTLGQGSNILPEGAIS